jgi:hypothetical protein
MWWADTAAHQPLSAWIHLFSVFPQGREVATTWCVWVACGQEYYLKTCMAWSFSDRLCKKICLGVLSIGLTMVLSQNTWVQWSVHILWHRFSLNFASYHLTAAARSFGLLYWMHYYIHLMIRIWSIDIQMVQDRSTNVPATFVQPRFWIERVQKFWSWNLSKSDWLGYVQLWCDVSRLSSPSLYVRVTLPPLFFFLAQFSSN